MNTLILLFSVSYLTFMNAADVHDIDRGIINADESDISYNFYTKNNSKVPIKIENNNAKALFKTHYDPTKMTVFVAHGLFDSLNPIIDDLVVNNIFKHNEVNLFLIEWSNAGLQVTASGEIIGKFINDIHKIYDNDGSSFVLVGFSLGGQLTGAIGRSVTKKIGHIIALDPQGVFYEDHNLDVDAHLDPSDATLVEVIHTNGEKYGKKTATGHIDYFPNGGMVQPACKEGFFNYLHYDICSHYRACHYFGKVLNKGSGTYKAQLCPDWDTYTRGKCANHTVREMGNLLPIYGTYGNYYLYINDTEFN